MSEKVIRAKDLKDYLAKFSDDALVVLTKDEIPTLGAYVCLDVAMEHLAGEKPD